MKLKQTIHNQLLHTAETKLTTLHQEIAGIKEARNNDTKSSAGDKFETGRQMMQIELDRLEGIYSQTNQLKTQLNLIDLTKQHTKVGMGSLVTTNQGSYYISVGLGKVEVNNKAYFALSLSSPIGKLLNGKAVGDKIEFNSREFFVEKIL